MIARTNVSKRKGSVLAYILVITSLSMMLLLAVIQVVVSRIQYAQYRENKEQSLQIAESGIYFYRWYLAHEVEGRTTQQIQDFWEGGSALGVGSAYERDVLDTDGTLRGSYRVTVTPPESYSTIVIVEAVGWTVKDPDIKRTVRARFRRPSWSEFAVLGDDYMRFGDGTTVMGPLHVNGGAHFDGLAYNTVSSAVEEYYDSDFDVNGWRDGVWTSWGSEYNTSMGGSVFSGGKEYPVPEQSFANVSTNLSIIKDAALDSGMYFDNDRQGRHIVLQTDGTFNIRKVRSYSSATNDILSYQGGWQTFDIPENGVIYVEDNIWLEGTIDGERITIAAADLIGGGNPNVFIGHDIRYTNYDGSDTIGVIAENDIEILKNSEDYLRIEAALLAQNGRVGRTYYIDHKDTISIFGALASNQRYGFAYTDGTGYNTRDLQYDNNLLYYPPPYFPTGDTYSIDLWEEL